MVEEFIRGNCEHFRAWDGKIKEIITTDDKIIAMDEYWADDGEAPDKSSGKRKQNIHIGYNLNGFIPWTSC